jgi:hypothetical protein
LVEIFAGGRKALFWADILARVRSAREPPSNTILFIPLSGNDCNPDFDWAAAGELIIRFCPTCLCDTIIGLADGANKLMMRVTTGLGFVAASARDAKQLSLSFPFSPYRTPTTV